MKWTKEDKEGLLAFKRSVDYDPIKIKEQIKEVLLNNRYIIHVLDNKELEKSNAEPSEYFGENIVPYYMVTDIQSNTQNFLCYEVGYKDLDRYNKSVKMLHITFYILCHQGNLIEKETGIARHDLLAALVQDQFNYTQYFGGTIQLVSDEPGVTDNKYAIRTLIFEQITDNNLVKSRKMNGTYTPKLINKEIHKLGDTN